MQLDQLLVAMQEKTCLNFLTEISNQKAASTTKRELSLKMLKTWFRGALSHQRCEDMHLGPPWNKLLPPDLMLVLIKYQQDLPSSQGKKNILILCIKPKACF